MISVIVPVFKVENYLDKCVRSILSQSYTDFELILVDDGSPDKCGQMCDAYAQEDKRIRVIHKPNGGLSDARNAGIREAKGDFFCFVDSDDSIDQDMLATLYKLEEETGADLVCCNFLQLDEEGKQVKETPSVKPGVYTQDEYWRMRFKSNVKIYYDVAWNKLYNRRLFESVKYPVGKIHEDVQVIYDIVSQCRSIAVTDKVGYYYLIRNNSIMRSSRSIRNLAEPEAFIHWAEGFYEKKKWFLAEESLSYAVHSLITNEYGKDTKKSREYREIKKCIRKLYKKLFTHLSSKRKVSLFLFCTNEGFARRMNKQYNR